MPNFAVLSGNTVSNLVVADTKESAEEATHQECIEYTLENEAAIGWIYNPETNKFTNPEAPVEE